MCRVLTGGLLSVTGRDASGRDGIAVIGTEVRREHQWIGVSGPGGEDYARLMAAAWFEDTVHGFS